VTDVVGVPKTDRGTWIQTYSGVKLHLQDPLSIEIEPLDIARGLAFQGRFSGQTVCFYSVAQHCCAAADYAQERYGGPMARIMLMHDAPEAYIGDMVRPAKVLMPDYQRMESALWGAIAMRFALPLEMPPEVKTIDNIMLAREKKALCPNSDPWPGLPETAEQNHFVVYTPDRAFAEFHKRFVELFPGDHSLVEQPIN